MLEDAINNVDVGGETEQLISSSESGKELENKKRNLAVVKMYVGQIYLGKPLSNQMHQKCKYFSLIGPNGSFRVDPY